MSARCGWCGRPLRRPSPDGYGPVCRGRLIPTTPTHSTTLAGRERLDHAALADHGQTAIPVQPELPDPGDAP